MKKTTLLSAALLAGLSLMPGYVGAQTSADADPDVVTLTTSKAAGDELTFTVNSGTFTVDWGDGNAVEVKSTGEPITGTLMGNTVTISANTITYLDCSSCGLTNLVLEAPGMTSLDCSNNKLSAIYIQAMPKLEILDCSDNELTTLYLAKSSKGNLRSLDCSNNQLGSLAVSECTNLQFLHCSSNALSSLSLSGLTSLNTLWCYSNTLTTLDLSSCANIQSVVCSDNKLTSLTPSSTARKIVDFWCNDNSLTSLSLGANPEIETVSCANNQIENLTLPVKSGSEKLLAAYLQNNKLCFSDFYATTKVEDYVYGPQNLFSLSKNSINVGESVDIPDNDKNVDGQSVNPEIRWVNSLTNEDLEYGRQNDYTYRSNTYTFLKPFQSVCCVMTSSLYPGLELLSEPLRVVDPTGVESVKTNGFVCYGHGGCLVMSAEKACNVKVFTVDGKIVWSGTVHAPVSLTLGTGVYVVNGIKVSL